MAQRLDSLKTWLIDFEIRPRAEYRANYVLSPADSVIPDFHITQRNRLTIGYLSRNLKVVGSFQEIHVWFKDKVSAVGSINAFELYAEPRISDKLSLRIGRQGVLLDNGRMFSDAPWSQQGRAHEGTRLMHTTRNVSNDLFFLFTRPYADHYDKTYSPVAPHQYKYLVIHYLKAKAGDHFTLSTSNSVEFMEQPGSGEVYRRITSGGRIEWERNGLYITVNGFYQYGKNELDQNLSAYYLQPEIRLKTDRTTLRLGMEILSGNQADGIRPVTQNFDISYGVAWKFMGNMNFFTSFPTDVGGKGLFNPYLFALYQLHPKFSARMDLHMFATQYPLQNQNGNAPGRYLGFENDISFRYRPVNQLEINYGFSYFLAEKEMELLPKLTRAERIPVWSYLMISYTIPVLRLPKR